jgi:carboxypeptidase T
MKKMGTVLFFLASFFPRRIRKIGPSPFSWRPARKNRTVPIFLAALIHLCISSSFPSSGPSSVSTSAAVAPLSPSPFTSGQVSQSGLRDAESRDIISIEKTPSSLQKLASLEVAGLELDRLFEWQGRIYILVHPEDLAALNIPYIIETPNFPALRSDHSFLQGGINGDYHSYLELEADLEALQSAYPTLARLFTIGTTLENRKITALKISDNAAQDEDEAEVLFLGCHHAREWISVEVPFLLGKHLLENYSSDPEIRRLVDRSEIWIVPLVNPDGLEYSIHFYRYWRKNRRFNSDGSYGVDINRNYGYQWGYDNRGSSPEPGSDVYRGTAPFSEPETQAVRNLFLEKNFRTMISYHSYSQVILYPWGYTTAPTDQDLLLHGLSAAMSSLMRPVNGRFYEYGPAAGSLYLTNGDTTDWTFSVSGIPSYTIELPPVDQLGGGFFNSERDILPIFRENLPAALYLVDWAVEQHDSSSSAAPANARTRVPRSSIRASSKKATSPAR